MISGWHALPMTPQHTFRDGFYEVGQLVATIESFSDAGPYYGNAITPDGQQHRSGPMKDHSEAAEWCEDVSSSLGIFRRKVP